MVVVVVALRVVVVVVLEVLRVVVVVVAFVVVVVVVVVVFLVVVAAVVVVGASVVVVVGSAVVVVVLTVVVVGFVFDVGGLTSSESETSDCETEALPFFLPITPGEPAAWMAIMLTSQPTPNSSTNTAATFI